MNVEELEQALAQALATIRALQEERAITNQSISTLEQKLEERSALLREAQEELQRTNSELLQLTLELEDRVIERTEELEEKEKTLHETNELLAAIIQASPLALDAVDRDGRVILWSPSAERLFGWKAEEVLGESLPIIPEVVQDDFRLQTEEGLQGHALTGKETQRQRKDGSLVPVSLSTAPFLNAQGQVTGVMAIVEDVTERKRIEAELSEVRHRLLISTETDRRVLAQEIHDGPIQDLYGISFSLKSLDRHDFSDHGIAVITEACDNVQLSINRLREICGELRPPTLAHLGLGKAILSYAQQHHERHPETYIEVSLQNDDEGLPEPVSLGLFRITQQALVNIARHAEAKHATIHLAQEDGQWVLEIRDDGKGFDVPKRWIEMVREGHLGLVGASERAEALGGHLEISSTPGKGTNLRASVPFPSTTTNQETEKIN